jgi:hypothetical protein
LAAGERCGDHDARDYVARVNAMKGVFDAVEKTAAREID